MKNKNLLILEDNFAMGQFLQNYFKTHYTAIWKQTVNDGVECLKKIKNINIIICDINLANTSGHDFIEYVRSTEFYHDIPIIVLSSNDSSGDKIKALQIGANDYLVKPFSPEELLLRIENLLADKIN